MDNIINVFNEDAFSLVNLTESINMVPNNYGLLNKLNLFPNKGVTTTSVAIEMKGQTLSLLAQGTRGETPFKNKRDKRTLKSFHIPHFSISDNVTADQIQNVKAFGNQSKLASIADIVNDCLAGMRGKHAITLEYLRCTALAGKVLDGAGNVILDMFNDFGITEKTFDFDFVNSDPGIITEDVVDHIEENLSGDTYSEIIGLCSAEFWKKLTTHQNVRDAFAFQQGQNINRDNLSKKGFDYKGIKYIKYNGKAQDMEGNTQPFIKNGECRFFPLGTTDTFKTYFAPADYIETANTIGQELYAKQEPTRMGKGLDIETQMNPLPFCNKPAVLVKGF